MMGTDIKLQGGGDVILDGVFDQVVAWKAIGIGQMATKQFVILRIVLSGHDEFCYLVSVLPDLM